MSIRTKQQQQDVGMKVHTSTKHKTFEITSSGTSPRR